MSLHGLDARFRENGRIRAGITKRTKDGKEYPARLEHWRLTTPSRALADEAAAAYGGEVHEWEPSRGGASGWEVLTTTEALDVVVPPYGKSLTQSWELWGGGGLTRRCDGRVQVTGERCACPAVEFRAQGNPREVCKPTSRLTVMLPALSGLGVWLLSTKGYNAAVELAAVEGLLDRAAAEGVWLEAVLRLEQRSSMVDGKRQDYVVPALDLPGLSVAGMASSGVQALAAGHDEPDDPEALGSGLERPQLGSPNEEAAPPPKPAQSRDVTPDDAPVTPQHLAAIHARCRELGISDAARRRAISKAFDDAESSADLTAGQARTFLGILDDPEHDWTVRMLELSAEDG